MLLNVLLALQAKVREQHEKEAKKKNWVNDVNEPLSPTPLPRPTPKPVDEDLYKISPGLLYEKAKKVEPSHPFTFFTMKNWNFCWPLITFIILIFNSLASFDKI